MGRNRRRPKPEFTVFFFDGKSETQMGTLRKFSTSTNFESFQAEVSKIIKKPPHQISVYLVNNDVTVDESTSFLKDDRTMRITDSLDDFGQVWSKKNSCLVVVTKEWERETISSQENVIECQACEYLKKTGGGSGSSYPHRCKKAEATAEGEEKSSFPVYFVDGESTEKKQIGTVSITCDTKFKRFQKEVIQIVNRSGNKISIYLVSDEVELVATKFWEDDRTIHINKKFKDFSRLIDQKNSSIVVVPIEYVQPQSGNVKETTASGSQQTLFPCEECDNAKKSGVTVPFHHCVNDPILPTPIREIEFPCADCLFARELGVRPWLHLCPNNPVKILERQNTV